MYGCETARKLGLVGVTRRCWIEKHWERYEELVLLAEAIQKVERLVTPVE